jgi:hypothetical protein
VTIQVDNTPPVSFAVLTLASPAQLAASEAPLAAAIPKAWPGAENMLSAINAAGSIALAASVLAFVARRPTRRKRRCSAW